MKAMILKNEGSLAFVFHTERHKSSLVPCLIFARDVAAGGVSNFCLSHRAPQVLSSAVFDSCALCMRPCCMKPRFGGLVSMALLCIYALTKPHGHEFACRSLRGLVLTFSRFSLHAGPLLL